MNIVFSICNYPEYCQILANGFNCNNVNPCYFPQRGPERRRGTALHIFPDCNRSAVTWDPEALGGDGEPSPPSDAISRLAPGPVACDGCR